jgi:hypothetical protein
MEKRRTRLRGGSKGWEITDEENDKEFERGATLFVYSPLAK